MTAQDPRVVARREREAVEAIYPSLRRFASAVRLAGEDANDLVREALVRTLQRKGSVTALENRGAYLRRAILNVALDHRPTASRRLRPLARMGPAPDAAPWTAGDLLAGMLPATSQ